MRAHRFKQLAILLAIAALPAAAQSQSARHGTRDGVAVKATPLARSAVLSFYLARGFSAEAIAPYADACALSFEVQNNTKKPLRLRLADWRTGGAAGSISFRLPESWEDEWTRRGVAGPARIAFRWAQFQAENVFEPGDWIMGMATLAATPAGPFRLVARYSDDKGNHEIDLDQLVCAKD